MSTDAKELSRGKEARVQRSHVPMINQLETFKSSVVSQSNIKLCLVIEVKYSVKI